MQNGRSKNVPLEMAKRKRTDVEYFFVKISQAERFLSDSIALSAVNWSCGGVEAGGVPSQPDSVKCRSNISQIALSGIKVDGVWLLFAAIYIKFTWYFDAERRASSRERDYQCTFRTHTHINVFVNTYKCICKHIHMQRHISLTRTRRHAVLNQKQAIKENAIDGKTNK